MRQACYFIAVGKRDKSQVNELCNQRSRNIPETSKKMLIDSKCWEGSYDETRMSDTRDVAAGLLAYEKADVGAVTGQDRAPVYIAAQDSR